MRVLPDGALDGAAGGMGAAGVRSALDPQREVTAAVVRWSGAQAQTDVDELTLEEPLDLRLRAQTAPGDAEAREPLAVIMRTPGDDDELAAGFLYSEGLLLRREELAGMTPGMDEDGLPSANALDIEPAAGVDLLRRVRDGGYSRRFAVNASCGVCGKNSVAAACATLPALRAQGFVVRPETLYGLPERLRAEQRVFAHTGGLHAAALFDGAGRLLALREDVGRHNAVDKLVGRALLDGTLPLDERILLVSGRLSFEIALKALAARIPVIAAVSAPSSLAVDLAQAGGVTLVGFLRGAHMNVYTHPQRIGLDGGATTAASIRA